MGKKESDQQPNKSHKTLREKLRKKREELKKHKKEKSDKKKLYNAEEEKSKYFMQTGSSKKKRDDGIKEHKLRKYIEKFVDIYEDDVEDFYELFETLDKGATVDISEANPKMQKCLKKMFKHLPLQKSKLEYQKNEESEAKLKPLIKELVSSAIENYMENGTQSENSENEEQSSDEEGKMKEEGKRKKNKKHKSNKNEQQPVDLEQQKSINSKVERQSILLYEDLQLYPQRIPTEEPNQEESIGPSIPAEHREYLAKMFEEQIKNGAHQQAEQEIKKERDNEESNQFDRIFSMSTQKESKKKNPQKAHIDDLPEELLAEGSAKIGEKQPIDHEDIEEYNKIHRPRKLIEEHQEMKRLGKYAEVDKDGNKKRVPFDRERDIVNGRSRSFMNNGVFFDFKERMTKPQGTNNFL